jgi:hypothetical protein
MVSHNAKLLLVLMNSPIVLEMNLDFID